MDDAPEVETTIDTEFNQGDEDRLNMLMRVAPAQPVQGIDVHGATFGEGSDEHVLAIVSFHTYDGAIHNFAIEVPAIEHLQKAMTDLVPIMLEKAAELKKGRN